MIMKRRVALNGQQLDQVDSRIVISAIEPGDGKESISATDRAGGYGQRVTTEHRSSMDLIVRFRILERGKSVSGMTNRASVLEAVNAWAAAGGVLTVNYKPGRRLNVKMVQAPGEGSLWDYTKEYAIVFRAYAVPYWEDSTETSETVSGMDAIETGEVTILGSGPAQANVTFTNGSGSTIDSMSLHTGDSEMAFSSLGLENGESLVIDHNKNLVRIRIYDGSTYRSAMAKRTSGSADDLIMTPGINYCGYNAAANCTMTVSWRSRYL